MFKYNYETEIEEASEYSAWKSSGKYLANRTKQGSYHISTRYIAKMVYRGVRWYAYRLRSFYLEYLKICGC